MNAQIVIVDSASEDPITWAKGKDRARIQPEKPEVILDVTAMFSCK